MSFANCQSYESNAQPLVSQDEFRATVTSASMEQVELIRQYDEDLTAAISECRALVAVLDEKAGSNAPGLGGLRKAIDDCQSISKQVIHLRGGATSNGSNEESTDGSSDETSGGKGGGSGGGGGGPARCRAEPRRRLRPAQRTHAVTRAIRTAQPGAVHDSGAIEMRSMRFPELVDTLTSQKQVPLGVHPGADRGRDGTRGMTVSRARRPRRGSPSASFAFRRSGGAIGIRFGPAGRPSRAIAFLHAPFPVPRTKAVRIGCRRA